MSGQPLEKTAHSVPCCTTILFADRGGARASRAGSVWDVRHPHLMRRRAVQRSHHTVQGPALRGGTLAYGHLELHRHVVCARRDTVPRALRVEEPGSEARVGPAREGTHLADELDDLRNLQGGEARSSRLGGGGGGAAPQGVAETRGRGDRADTREGRTRCSRGHILACGETMKKPPLRGSAGGRRRGARHRGDLRRLDVGGGRHFRLLQWFWPHLTSLEMPTPNRPKTQPQSFFSKHGPTAFRRPTRQGSLLRKSMRIISKI